MKFTKPVSRTAPKHKYEAAVCPLFEGKELLIGNQLTEADIRLWVTTVRFRVTSPGMLVFGCLTLCNRSRFALGAL